MKDRDEHLAWCKKRALEYLDQHDAPSAVISMLRDLKEHPETPVNAFIEATGFVYAAEDDEPGVRRWIEGFR